MYTKCHGCNFSYKVGAGLSNHQRGCGALIAKLASMQVAATKIKEQQRLIDEQSKIIEEQQRQILKLSNNQNNTVINNNTNINIINIYATEKVVSAITERFNYFNNAIQQWISYKKENNEPLKLSLLFEDLNNLSDKTLVETLNVIGGVQENFEIDVEEEEIRASDEELVIKCQDNCISNSRKMLQILDK